MASCSPEPDERGPSARIAAACVMRSLPRISLNELWIQEIGKAALEIWSQHGLHPDLMPLELRGIRAINGLHSSDRVQRIP